jgi:PTS system mannose-specific IIA component
MIGVVVATHGHLAEELIRTAETVVGPLEATLGVGVVATSPSVRADLKTAIAKVDHGEGVLLLTDILGGSPTNLCLSFLNERKIEVVTGVNLAMLLRLPELRAKNLNIEKTAQAMAEAGQKSVALASEALRRML